MVRSFLFSLFLSQAIFLAPVWALDVPFSATPGVSQSELPNETRHIYSIYLEHDQGIAVKALLSSTSTNPCSGAYSITINDLKGDELSQDSDSNLYPGKIMSLAAAIQSPKSGTYEIILSRSDKAYEKDCHDLNFGYEIQFLFGEGPNVPTRVELAQPGLTGGVLGFLESHEYTLTLSKGQTFSALAEVESRSQELCQSDFEVELTSASGISLDRDTVSSLQANKAYATRGMSFTSENTGTYRLFIHRRFRDETCNFYPYEYLLELQGVTPTSCNNQTLQKTCKRKARRSCHAKFRKGKISNMQQCKKAAKKKCLQKGGSC
ncbi:MAG: hypothetical protein KDD62_07545 [Bdellovibrionales bacterium]|nr:hypothetical protein [Bdellovibrionales bacterium]